MKKFVNYLEMLSRLTNAEHFDTIEAIVKYLEPHAASIDGFTGVWNTLQSSFQTEDLLFKQNQKQPGTQDVIKADAVRDGLYQDLRREVTYHTFSKIALVAEAANQVMLVINTYKNADKAAYTQNSALVTNLVEDLRLPKYTQAVAQLNVKGIVDKLDEANEAFKQLFRDRSAEVNAASDQNLREARKNTDAAFDTAARCLEGFYTTGLMTAPTNAQTTLLGDIIDRLNSYLITARNILARRVPSYSPGTDSNSPAEPETPGNPDENWETYMMTVDHDYWNTLPEQPYLFFFFFDANPDAFDKRFRGVDLSGANFYWGIDTDNDETFFSHYLEENGKLVGFAAYNNRLNVDGKVEGKDAALRRNGVDLIRLDKAHAPEFID